MQVSLDQTEIELAIRDYVRTIINIPEDREIGIDFTAGRGSNGLTAALDIRAKTSSGKKPTVTPATERRVGTPTAVKEEPEAEPVEEADEAPEPEPEAAEASKPADEPEVTDTGEDTSEDTASEAPAPRSIFAKKSA